MVDDSEAAEHIADQMETLRAAISRTRERSLTASAAGGGC